MSEVSIELSVQRTAVLDVPASRQYFFFGGGGGGQRQLMQCMYLCNFIRERHQCMCVCVCVRACVRACVSE